MRKNIGKSRGFIRNISVNETVLDGAGRISMEKFTPLVFDHATNDYRSIGGVAGKAFEAGKALE